tara:strand:+ start:790 stop:1425 length:636 start_codon:yes stop_codon:yes gene_type:complete
MATDQERAVQKSFDRAMEQINKLQRAFREEGLLAKAVADMGGNTKFNDIQDAMSNLYDALEDGHYDAFSGRSGASMHGEAKEKPVKEAVNQALIDQVVDQIIKDLDMGDQTAIEELLMSVPEHNLRGFLSDYGGNPSESVSEASLSLDKAKEYFFRDHDFGEENIGYEYDRISKRMTPEDAKILKKELQDMYGDSMSESNAVSDLKKLAGL